MGRLYAAVQNGDDGPPVDLRFIAKPLSRVGADSNSVRSDVVSYLNMVYESVAETIPDVRDSAFDAIDGSDLPSLDSKPLDVYSIELKRQVDEANKPLCSKPRKKRKAVEMNPERAHGDSAPEVKYLAPGFMKEYWVQYKAASALEQPASFPTFWREAWPFFMRSLFGDFC